MIEVIVSKLQETGRCGKLVLWREKGKHGTRYILCCEGVLVDWEPTPQYKPDEQAIITHLILDIRNRLLAEKAGLAKK